MTADSYDVYFSGAIIKDNDPAEVKRKIGAVFKLEGDKLERLFSGKPIPIKRGVDMDRAIKFRVTFRDAGGLVDIVPAGEPPPAPRPQPQTADRPAPSIPASPPRQEAEELGFADGPMEPATSGDEVTPIAVPDYELSSAQGFDLSDCTPKIEAAEIPDISAMQMERPGSTLDETPEPELLEIDTSALMLDSPGVTLIEDTPAQPPDIDTSALDVLPANQGTLEDCQKPVDAAPIPNIDHLKIDQQAQDSDQDKGKAKFKIADE
ncbi:MAG: hypothetical protein AB2598_18270 [Candidatus Thiodiazotropha sp.]